MSLTATENMKLILLMTLFVAILAWAWHTETLWTVLNWAVALAVGVLSAILGTSMVITAGKRYKPEIPNGDPNTATLLISKMMESRKTYQPPEKKIVISHNLDLAIQEVMDCVIRDYVLSWYQTLGQDSDRFKAIVEQEVWHMLEQFGARLIQIDKVRFLTKDIVDALSQHFQDIRLASQEPEDGGEKPKFQLYPWLSGEERELEFLRKVAEVFLIYLLPKHYTVCSSVRHLLKEILSNAVFKPAVDLICDPDYVNGKLYNWLDWQEQLLAQHKKTYTYAATYEDFVQMIQQSNNVDELKQMRYNIISEVMQATTIQNLKRAKGIDTDKESAPRGTAKGDLLKARNLKRYINQLTIAKAACERRIHSLGGPDYKADTDDTRRAEHQQMRGKKVLAFSIIMDSAEARRYFLKYLNKDGHDPMLQFWTAVESMRQAHKRHWHQMAAEIYQMYIAHPTSVVRLQLDRVLFKGMEAFMVGDTGPEAFHDAQEQIYQVLEELYYPSFILSDIYHHYVTSCTDNSKDTQSLASRESDDSDEGLDRKMSTSKDEMGQAIAEHSTYAQQKLRALDDRILNKSQALKALKQSQKPDPRMRKLQEDIEGEIEALRLERRQLEFHIDRTEVWLENVARWNAHIYNSEVVQEGDKMVPCFVVVIHLPGCMSSALPTSSKGSHTQGWIVTRKLQDFHQLHHQLIQINPNLKKINLPSVSKLWFRSINEEFLNKSKLALDGYLSEILSDEFLAQSEAVFAFFSPSPEHLKQAPPQIKRNKFSFGSFFKSQREQESDSDDELLFVDDDSGKVEKSKDSIAKPLYMLIGEIFELRGMFRWLRRTLMVFVKVTFGSSINRQLQDTVHWVVSEPMLIYYLRLFREAYWPNGELVHAAPPRTDEEKLKTRYLAKEKILQNTSDVVKNLVGEKNARHGFIKVFEALQDVRLNKHLFYTLLELFLYETFPELQDFRNPPRDGIPADDPGIPHEDISDEEENIPKHPRHTIPPFTL